MILGTNKFLTGGGLNNYFTERIRSTVELFQKQKINKIIVSGYKESKYYNEPLLIKNELINSGIPSSAILLDMDGSRTFNSIRNLKGIDTSDDISIISQKFHNQRAVFLALKKGYHVVGFNVPNSNKSDNFQTMVRESLAKVLAFFEVIIKE